MSESASHGLAQIYVFKVNNHVIWRISWRHLLNTTFTLHTCSGITAIRRTIQAIFIKNETEKTVFRMTKATLGMNWNRWTIRNSLSRVFLAPRQCPRLSSSSWRQSFQHFIPALGCHRRDAVPALSFPILWKWETRNTFGWFRGRVSLPQVFVGWSRILVAEANHLSNVTIKSQEYSVSCPHGTVFSLIPIPASRIVGGDVSRAPQSNLTEFDWVGRMGYFRKEIRPFERANARTTALYSNSGKRKQEIFDKLDRAGTDPRDFSCSASWVDFVWRPRKLTTS